MAGGADLDDTPRWRLSVLFMFIVVFSLAGHIGLHKLEDYFRRQKRLGLKHTLQSLKDELFALGLITLLLIVLQDQIVKMCIDGGDDYYGYDSYDSGYSKNRKLLAGTGDSYKCPKGQESFWSLTALHEIHILIFLIAVVHLTQAAVSMVLASLRVRRWKKYEDRVCHDMIPLKRKGAIKHKGSWTGLWIYSFVTQFSNSVDGPVYLAIRRLFLEKMELDDDFNFYNYVVDSMEEDFAKLVEFQWVMWLIAAILILLPWEAYAIIWLPCLSLIIMLIVGAKLQSVAIQLGSLAYTHYSPHFIPHKDRKKSGSFIGKSTKKLRSMIVKNSSLDNLTQLAKKQGMKDVEEDVPQTPRDVETPRQGPPSLGAVSVNPSVPQPTFQTKKSGISVADSISSGSDIEEGKIPKMARSGSKIAEYLAQSRLLKDSASLFWFGKPKLMLRVFQYIYFQSGLLMSLLILDEWRGQRVNHLTGHVLYILMIAVNLLVVVHGSLFVLPTYAISVAAGAYGPDNVLRKALKRNVNPTLAKRLDLERRSFGLSTQDSFSEGSIGEIEEEAGHHGEDDQGGHGGHSGGHGHGDSMRIDTLLRAMDNSSIRKKKMEEMDARDAEQGIGRFYRVDSKEEPIPSEEFQETITAPARVSEDVTSNVQN